GFSNIMLYLSPLLKSDFDTYLGKTRISDASPQMAQQIGNKKLFPKETFFKLALGNASVILENLKRSKTPLIFLTPQNTVFPGYQSNLAFENLATLVAFLDPDNPTSQIQTRDVADFLIALQKYFQALQWTPQHLLPEKKHIQEQVRLLALGLANYLVSKVQSPKGFIYSRYNLSSGSVVQEEPDLHLQFRSLQALLAAIEITGISAYQWPLIDIYRSLNRYVWNKGFYKGANIFHFVEGLYTLEQLSQAHILSFEESQNLNQALNLWTEFLSNDN
ncbi:MAG: hypothetical protein D6797_04120, partial [Bdellovibrio sp.]